jgi:hypothetical protein
MWEREEEGSIWIRTAGLYSMMCHFDHCFL